MFFERISLPFAAFRRFYASFLRWHQHLLPGVWRRRHRGCSKMCWATMGWNLGYISAHDMNDSGLYCGLYYFCFTRTYARREF
jgi:hypothetical protein